MRREAADRGAVLPIFVVAILALIAFAALAVDLGWAYLNGERQQKAADAAALAAVVNLPAETAVWEASTSFATAIEYAGRNGYAPGEVSPQQVFTGTGRLVSNRVKVDVTRTFDTFFFDIFGVDDLTLTRSATAEFLPPLQLGSDGSALGAFPSGTGCDPLNPLPGCIDPADPSTWGGTNPGLWVAINGRFTAKEEGDPFTTRCLRSTTATSCITPNGEYEPDGNYYAIEVPGGASVLTVDLFDPVFWGGGGTFQVGAGDQTWRNGGHFDTTFTLLAPDGTAANPRDNSTVLCSRTFPADVGYDPQTDRFLPGNPANFTMETLCTVSTTPGVHVLRVTVEAGRGHGANGFSIRATTNAGAAKVYGSGRMSLRTNMPVSSPRFQLANVPPSYAGRSLTISLFDPGDTVGDAFVSFKGRAEPFDCTIEVRRLEGGTESLGSPSGTRNGSACWIQSTSGATIIYNGDWLDFTFDVPADYDCDFPGGGCWWEVQYDYTATEVRDRTTWEANVRGTPVRLVFDP